MSDFTPDGSRFVTTSTKTTNITKITKAKWLFVVLVIFVAFVAERPSWRVSGQTAPAAQPQAQAQQRPVFRGGTNFVRVDAYPLQDGKIVEGLTAEDFEVLEDGKPQQIDSFDFIKFDTFTPDAVRRDPSSQREGFDMAADPRYRVFVIFVDQITQPAGLLEGCGVVIFLPYS